MNFKNPLRLAGLAAVATLGFTQSALAINSGELVMGFRDGTGTNANPDLLLNLGNLFSSSIYTTPTAGTPVFIANINTDLIAAFGSTWSSSNAVTFGVAGFESANPTTGAQHFWLSDKTGSAIFSNSNQSQAEATANRIGTVFGTSVGTGIGTTSTIADSNNSSWTKQVGNTSNAFSFTSGVATTSFLQNTNFTSNSADRSATITTAYRDADGVVTWSQNIGTFTLASNGDVSFTATAVPEPSTYGLIGAGALAAVAAVRRRRNKVA